MSDYTVVRDIDTIFKEYPNCNMLVITNAGSSINRTFCKCGHFEKKAIYSCPVCGNNNFAYERDFNILYSMSFNPSKTVVNFNVKNFTIKVDSAKKEFYIDTGIDTTILRLQNEKLQVVDLSFFNDGYYWRKDSKEVFRDIESLKAFRLGNFDFEMFRKEYVDFDKEFDKFNYGDYYEEYSHKSGHMFFGRKYETNSLDMLFYFSYVLLKNRIPDFFEEENFSKPFIVQLMLRNHMKEIADETSFKQILSDLGLTDFKDYLGKDWFYPSQSTLEISLDNYKVLNKKQRELVLYATEHYNMSYDEVDSLSKEIITKTGTYSSKKSALFVDFAKTNLITFRNNIVEEFEKRVNFLDYHKIPINSSSIKNYSFYSNLESLKDEKYPIENVNLVADIFTINPLLGMKYLKSKSAFTEKQKNEIMKLIE